MISLPTVVMLFLFVLFVSSNGSLINRLTFSWSNVLFTETASKTAKDRKRIKKNICNYQLSKK